MALLLLAAAMLGVLGCGGESSGSELTKAEFIKKANQVCRVGEEERYAAKAEKVRELGIEPGEIATPAEQKQVIFAALSGFENSTERLQELIPSDQEARLAPLIEAREEVAEAVRADPGKTAASFPLIKKANLLAGEYGLDECEL